MIKIKKVIPHYVTDVLGIIDIMFFSGHRRLREKYKRNQYNSHITGNIWARSFHKGRKSEGTFSCYTPFWKKKRIEKAGYTYKDNNIDMQIQLNLNSSNIDDSFTMANSNSFLSSYEFFR